MYDRQQSAVCHVLCHSSRSGEIGISRLNECMIGNSLQSVMFFVIALDLEKFL